MKRIDTSTVEADKFGSGKDGFTDGDPEAGPPVPATVVNEDWFDSVQEEICNAITESGITLDGADRGQLSDAIRSPGSITPTSIAINDTDNSTSPITVKGVATSGATTGATISVNSGRGSFPSSLTAVQSGDEIGRLAFGAVSAANTWSEERAYLSAVASQTWSGSQQGNSLKVFTTASGATSAAERLSIDSSGFTIPSTETAYAVRLDSASKLGAFTADERDVSYGHTNKIVFGPSPGVSSSAQTDSTLVLPLNFIASPGNTIKEIAVIITNMPSSCNFVIRLIEQTHTSGSSNIIATRNVAGPISSNTSHNIFNYLSTTTSPYTITSTEGLFLLFEMISGASSQSVKIFPRALFTMAKTKLGAY